jgi:hypothetical protein
MSDGRRPRRLQLVSLAMTGVLVMPGLTACGSDEPDRRAYCVDENNQVVDDSYCDDGYHGGGGGGGFFFLMLASGSFGRGSVIPSSAVYGSRINPADTAARTRAGLPGTGRAAGTTIRSGGIGSGSSGGDGDSSRTGS